MSRRISTKASNDPEMSALIELKDLFEGVARKHTRSVRARLLSAAETLGIGADPADDADAIERSAEVYEDVIDALEQEAPTNPEAKHALNEIGIGVRRVKARLMSDPEF